MAVFARQIQIVENFLLPFLDQCGSLALFLYELQWQCLSDLLCLVGLIVNLNSAAKIVLAA